MGATHGLLSGADKAWMGERRVWGKVHKAASPEEEGVISISAKGPEQLEGRLMCTGRPEVYAAVKGGHVGGGLGSEGWRWGPGHVDSWPGSEGPLSGSNIRWGPEGVKPAHGYGFSAGEGLLFGEGRGMLGTPFQSQLKQGYTKRVQAKGVQQG